jgi:Protein of unknown function (DUF3626)
MATEREAALGRLAGQETLSLTELRTGMTKPEVLRLVKRVQDTLHMNTSDAVKFVRAAGALLRSARLTINFSAANWFRGEITGTTYLTCWEIVKYGISGKGSGYDRTRDATEENLFHYSDPTKDVKRNVPREVVDRIKAHGVRRSEPTHPNQVGAYGANVLLPANPGMRPKYAALDFGEVKQGAAGNLQYGFSYFVLNHVMRFNSTFTPRDSFAIDRDNPKVDELCTYHTIEKLLLYCPDKLLPEIKKVVDSPGGKRPDQILKGMHYIEACIHSDVAYARDVSQVVIAKSEMGGDWSTRRLKSKNLGKFLKANNLNNVSYYAGQ